MSKDKENNGEGLPDDHPLFKFFKKQGKHDRKMREIGSESIQSGYGDVAEAMHIITSVINDSNDLNIASVIPVSKVFDAVFQAFISEADPNIIEGSIHKKFINECGIVTADGGCLEASPAGGIRLHDLQLVAGLAAMRFFLFSRLRKIEACLPIIREMMDDGDLDKAAASLTEASTSAICLLNTMHKLGFGLVDDHPVATKALAGLKESKKLMEEIIAAMKKRGGEKPE